MEYQATAHFKLLSRVHYTLIHYDGWKPRISKNIDQLTHLLLARTIFKLVHIETMIRFT